MPPQRVLGIGEQPPGLRRKIVVVSDVLVLGEVPQPDELLPGGTVHLGAHGLAAIHQLRFPLRGDVGAHRSPWVRSVIPAPEVERS